MSEAVVEGRKFFHSLENNKNKLYWISLCLLVTYGNKDWKYFYNLHLLLYGPQNTLQFHSFFNAIHFMHILFIEHIVFSRQTDIFKQNKEIRGKRRQLNCQPIKWIHAEKLTSSSSRYSSNHPIRSLGFWVYLNKKL